MLAAARCADDGLELRSAVFDDAQSHRALVGVDGSRHPLRLALCESTAVLTSFLYVVFFAMCVVGLRDWLRDSAAQRGRGRMTAAVASES